MNAVCDSSSVVMATSCMCWRPWCRLADTRQRKSQARTFLISVVSFLFHCSTWNGMKRRSHICKSTRSAVIRSRLNCLSFRRLPMICAVKINGLGRQRSSRIPRTDALTCIEGPWIFRVIANVACWTSSELNRGILAEQSSTSERAYSRS